MRLYVEEVWSSYIGRAVAFCFVLRKSQASPSRTGNVRNPGEPLLLSIDEKEPHKPLV